MEKRRVAGQHSTKSGRANTNGDGDLSIESKRYKVSKQRRKDGIEGQGGEQLMLSMKDVRVCRTMCRTPLPQGDL